MLDALATANADRLATTMAGFGKHVETVLALVW